MTPNRPGSLPALLSPRLRRLLFAACLLSSAGIAQQFVFVSDRLLQDETVKVDGYYYSQAELFLYRDGSELRLTRTPNRSEYDPAVSPDGSRIAFAWRGLGEPGAESTDWEWHLSVVDALLGQEIATWPLPNSRRLTRPAGGFRIEWLPDGGGILALTPEADAGWSVWHFDLASPSGARMTGGYGPFLSPSGTLFATESDGRGHAWSATGVPVRTLQPGVVLGWYDERRLFMVAFGVLGTVDAETGEWEPIASYEGTYHALAMGPGGHYYAFLLQQAERWYVVVHDSDHRFVEDYAFPAGVAGIDWLADDRLLVSMEMEDGDLAIVGLDLEGNDPILVDSKGYDFAARALLPSGARP